jgi:hypothetical protein
VNPLVIVRVVCGVCNKDVAQVQRAPDGELLWHRPATKVIRGDGWAIGDDEAAVVQATSTSGYAGPAVTAPLVRGGSLHWVWCRRHGTGWIATSDLDEAIAEGTPHRPAFRRVTPRQ